MGVSVMTPALQCVAQGQLGFAQDLVSSTVSDMVLFDLKFKLDFPLARL